MIVWHVVHVFMFNTYCMHKDYARIRINKRNCCFVIILFDKMKQIQKTQFGSLFYLIRLYSVVFCVNTIFRWYGKEVSYALFLNLWCLHSTRVMLICVYDKMMRHAPTIDILNEYRDDGVVCIDSVWSLMMIQSRAPVFLIIIGFSRVAAHASFRDTIISIHQDTYTEKMHNQRIHYQYHENVTDRH